MRAVLARSVEAVEKERRENLARACLAYFDLESLGREKAQNPEPIVEK
jgi:hypothetical protein